ncbi:MAG: M28 family peptidase [Bacteroidales bacterium]|nr:M28 family peptidase [Bacteroidales bacterium]
MKCFSLLLLVIISLIGFSQTKEEICKEDISLHLNFLAGDSLKGRYPGTLEDKLAAEYIKSSFKNFGLKPLFKDFLQPFTILVDVEPGQYNSLEFGEKKFKLEKDFIPLSFSANLTLATEAVFVGYGFDVEQDNFKWNDYENANCKNKWVIVLKGFPEIKGENPLTAFARLRNKVTVAKDYGAAGVIFVSGVKYEKQDVLSGIFYDRIGADSGIPVIQITRKTANTILGGISDTLKIEVLEKQIDESKKPIVFDVSKKISAQTEIIKRTATTYNVVGLIEGKSSVLKTKYIVIGAHYDHLGFGGPGTGSRNPDTLAIHYGADDNASGTVGIMELAEILCSEKTNHSVIIVAFGAEEMGLLGSKHFMENLPVDKKDISLMINLDMIGRLEKSFTIGGTGTAVEFDSILNTISTETQFFKSPEGYGPSDHASFYSENIPVLYFNSGIHTDYHTPEDKIEKINQEGMKIILDFVYNVFKQTDKSDNRLSFKEAGSKTQSKQQNLKVTLGIIPDFGGAKEGLGIGGVKKGGPAEAAGLKKGDIIKSINGNKVGDIYEYMQRLSKLKEGETAILEIERNLEKIVVLVQL